MENVSGIKRYQGRRFAAFMLSLLSLDMAVFLADKEIFPAFVGGLVAIITIFVTGQSATDWKATK